MHLKVFLHTGVISWQGGYREKASVDCVAHRVDRWVSLPRWEQTMGRLTHCPDSVGGKNVLYPMINTFKLRTGVLTVLTKISHIFR